MTYHHVQIRFNNGTILNIDLDEANYSYLNKIMWNLNLGKSVKIGSYGYEYTINPNNICYICEYIPTKGGEIQ